ncbi:MAG: hypothetical protein FJW34_16845 [Acidobacteria bacterium]|nr:hypothetical protein [Acidobacteriota bacterium]
MAVDQIRLEGAIKQQIDRLDVRLASIEESLRRLVVLYSGTGEDYGARKDEPVQPPAISPKVKKR